MPAGGEKGGWILLLQDHHRKLVLANSTKQPKPLLNPKIAQQAASFA